MVLQVRSLRVVNVAADLKIIRSHPATLPALLCESLSDAPNPSGRGNGSLVEITESQTVVKDLEESGACLSPGLAMMVWLCESRGQYGCGCRLGRAARRPQEWQAPTLHSLRIWPSPDFSMALPCRADLIFIVGLIAASILCQLVLRDHFLQSHRRHRIFDFLDHGEVLSRRILRLLVLEVQVGHGVEHELRVQRHEETRPRCIFKQTFTWYMQVAKASCMEEDPFFAIVHAA